MLFNIILYYCITPIITLGSYIYIKNYEKKIYKNTIETLSKYIKLNYITPLNDSICVKIIGNKNYVIEKSKLILSLKIHCINYKLIQENNQYILYLYLKPYAINHITKNKYTNSSNVIIIHI